LDGMTMKGKDPKQYENHIVEGFTNRGKMFKEHFKKYNINIDDYQ
jgi:hypothetical protein